MKQLLILLVLLSTIALNADDYRTIQRHTSIVGNNGENHKIGDFGNYYALLIYVERYQNLQNLHTPKKDVNAIAKILKDRYGFTETRIVPNPKNSDELIGVLDDFKNRLNSNDNLLIYYAGHGSKNGYWQLVDAQKRTRVGWISVKEAINQTLKEMRSKHILVIADSCYSGFLTRDGVSMSNLSPNDKRYYSKLYAMKSRNVLTSGSLQPVLDQDPTNPNHSVFANGFLKMLKKNSRAIFSLEEQYPKVKRYVRLNTENQVPLYGDVKLTGHEDGGDFIFLDRKVISKTKNSDTIVKSIEPKPHSTKYTTTINGKMWQDEPYTKEEEKAYKKDYEYGKVLKWDNAMKYCKNLSLGGYSNWRLPSKEELQKLYKNKNQLKNVASSGYWSSTTYASDSSHAWFVNFNNGYDYWYSKTYEYYVRCVRGRL